MDINTSYVDKVPDVDLIYTALLFKYWHNKPVEV